MRTQTPSLDIVIPVYNEAEILPRLFAVLEATFAPDVLAREGLGRVRYVFVDDGSRDASACLIQDSIAAKAPAMLVRLTRNFGHAGAIMAGLDHADADLVAVLDADLQDPPAFILDMVRQWREGFDVIHAVRTKRKERLAKVLCYKLFYRIMNRLADVDIPLDSGDFCLMDRKVVDVVRRLPEKVKFPRYLRCWVGFRQTEMPYERQERAAGDTKYSLARLYSLATGGFISSGTRLLRMAQLCCMAFLLLSFALMLVTVVFGLAGHSAWSLLLLGCSFVAFCNAVQSLLIYIFGGYLGRVYLEVQGRPPYLVLEVLQ